MIILTIYFVISSLQERRRLVPSPPHRDSPNTLPPGKQKQAVVAVAPTLKIPRKNVGLESPRLLSGIPVQRMTSHPPKLLVNQSNEPLIVYSLQDMWKPNQISAILMNLRQKERTIRKWNPDLSKDPQIVLQRILNEHFPKTYRSNNRRANQSKHLTQSQAMHPIPRDAKSF